MFKMNFNMKIFIQEKACKYSFKDSLKNGKRKVIFHFREAGMAWWDSCINLSTSRPYSCNPSRSSALLALLNNFTTFLLIIQSIFAFYWLSKIRKFKLLHKTLAITWPLNYLEWKFQLIFNSLFSMSSKNKAINYQKSIQFRHSILKESFFHQASSPLNKFHVFASDEWFFEWEENFENSIFRSILVAWLNFLLAFGFFQKLN